MTVLEAAEQILKRNFEGIVPALKALHGGQSVLEKLNLRDRTQLAVFYYKNVRNER